MSSLALTCILGNEATNIASFLSLVVKLPVEDVILVCNGTDNTLEKVLEYSETDPRVKIITSEWHGDFSEQRNLALDNTLCDYRLILDADDTMSEESIKELVVIKEKYLDPDSIISANITNIGADTWAQNRIFPSRCRFVGAVHEQVPSEGFQIKHFSYLSILHTGYVDPEIKIQKAKRNIALLEANPADTVSYWHMYGDSLMIIQRLHHAETCYRKCLQYQTTEYFKNYMFYCIGKIKHLQGDLDNALTYYIMSGRADAAGYASIILYNRCITLAAKEQYTVKPFGTDIETVLKQLIIPN